MSARWSTAPPVPLSREATTQTLRSISTRSGLATTSTFPSKGGSRRGIGAMEFTASPEVASIYRPDGEIAVTRWPGGTRNLAVKIDQVAVDRALESLVDGPVESLIPFEASLPLNGRAAQSWVRLLLMVLSACGGGRSRRQGPLLSRADAVWVHGIAAASLSSPGTG